MIDHPKCNNCDSGQFTFTSVLNASDLLIKRTLESKIENIQKKISQTKNELNNELSTLKDEVKSKQDIRKEGLHSLQEKLTEVQFQKEALTKKKNQWEEEIRKLQQPLLEIARKEGKKKYRAYIKSFDEEAEDDPTSYLNATETEVAFIQKEVEAHQKVLIHNNPHPESSFSSKFKEFSSNEQSIKKDISHQKIQLKNEEEETAQKQKQIADEYSATVSNKKDELKQLECELDDLTDKKSAALFFCSQCGTVVGVSNTPQQIDGLQMRIEDQIQKLSSELSINQTKLAMTLGEGQSEIAKSIGDLAKAISGSSKNLQRELEKVQNNTASTAKGQTLGIAAYLFGLEGELPSG